MLKDERYETLLRQIGERLAPICADMPTENFDEMVHDIAVNARKSELRFHGWPLVQGGGT